MKNINKMIQVGQQWKKAWPKGNYILFSLLQLGKVNASEL